MARTVKEKRKDKAKSQVIAALLLIIFLLIGYIFINRNSADGSFLSGFTQSVSKLGEGIKSSLHDLFPEIDFFIDKPALENLAEGTMKVHVIDVGQGSATLIETDKHTILIDTGDEIYGNVVVDYLKSKGIAAIDILVLTHPHADHIGGADNVLAEFHVETIIMPPLPQSLTPTSLSYTNLLDILELDKKMITPSNAGESFELGGLILTIIGPDIVYDNLNDMSIICRVSYGKRSLIVTGDAGQVPEKKAVNSGISLKSDILIVGHHGSADSSNEGFVSTVNPSFVAISLGAGNSYGHPHEEVVKLIENLALPYYRTDKNGTIIFICSEEEIVVESEK